MYLIGTILKRGEITSKTETFKVQQFYLDSSIYDQFTGEKRENYLKFQLINSNIEALKHFRDGERVKVHFNLKGRFFEHEGEKKHAQDITAWKIERVTQNGALTIPEEVKTIDMEKDDLPF